MSKQGFLLMLITASSVSIVIFGLVLPVYYHLDPIGLGSKLGIIGLKSQFISDGHGELDTTSLPPTSQTTHSTSATPKVQTEIQDETRQNTFVVTVPAKSSADYWLKMERDYELEYYWKTDSQPLHAEFRGEPNDMKQGNSKTFGKPLLGNAGKGFFIAPFNGRIGWHWQNKTDQPIVLRLTAKGHYQVIDQVANPSPK